MASKIKKERKKESKKERKKESVYVIFLGCAEY